MVSQRVKYIVSDPVLLKNIQILPFLNKAQTSVKHRSISHVYILEYIFNHSLKEKLKCYRPMGLILNLLNLFCQSIVSYCSFPTDTFRGIASISPMEYKWRSFQLNGNIALDWEPKSFKKNQRFFKSRKRRFNIFI